MRPNIDAIKLRSNLVGILENYLRSSGYYNVPTPIFCNDLWDKSEAFTVHRNKEAVAFLAPSPQAYKLELVSSGIPEYFQIAPCFRAEDAHDRKINGVHYQIDIETTNKNVSQFKDFIETLLCRSLSALGTNIGDQFFNIPSISFDDSIQLYGTDKPDIRNPVRLVRMIDERIFGRTGKLAIAIPRGDFETIEFHSLAAHVLAEEDTKLELLDGTFRLNEHNHAYSQNVANSNFDLFRLLTFKPNSDHEFSSSHTANCVGKFLNLIDTAAALPIWISEFPLFSTFEQTIRPYHDLFTAPLTSTRPLDKYSKAQQFDLVCNGVELASCAVRIADFNTLMEVLRVCDIEAERVQDAHPNLYGLFRSGLNPSIGCGIGLERLLMIIQKAESIEDVLPFS